MLLPSVSATAADALDGKSRSQLTGKNALTKKVQSRHNLNKSLKRGAKGVAAKAAHNALKDSELEGTDDLVATLGIRIKCLNCPAR